ncbi:hypothetical protein DT87_06175 [Streptomyces sp. NTK 937]|nr:hypothetical protein DT87_06175 [Streptomyces sp. NTK 937]
MAYRLIGVGMTGPIGAEHVRCLPWTDPDGGVEYALPTDAVDLSGLFRAHLGHLPLCAGRLVPHQTTFASL